MFKEYDDDKHKEQAEDFIFSLGKFVLQFEKVCDVMRHLIMFILRSQGLKNEGMEQVIIGDKAAAELQMLLGALYYELPNQDENDHKAIKALLKSLKELTEKRNILLHNSWHLGDKAGDEELYAATVRYRTKQTKGSETEIIEFSASYINELTEEAKKFRFLFKECKFV